MTNSKQHTLRALVIQDAAEAMRQPHADLGSFFTECIDKVCRAESHRSRVDVMAGEEALDIVANLDHSHYDVLILASNAMIRSDGILYQAFKNNQQTFQKFVHSGHGVLILHQGFSGVSSNVEFLSFANASEWAAIESITPEKSEWFHNMKLDNKSAILNFPYHISEDTFDLKADGTTKSGFPPCYFAVKIDDTEESSLHSVASFEASDHVYSFVASYEHNGRLVLCSYPADWAHDIELVQNLIHFAAYGVPRLVFLTGAGEDSNNTQSYQQVLRSRLESVATSAEVNIFQESLSSRDGYLLSNGRLFVATNTETIAKAETIERIQESINTGAALVKSKPLNSMFAEELTLVKGPSVRVGTHSRARRIQMELKPSTWIANALLHDVRDFIFAIMDRSPRPDQLEDRLGVPLSDIGRRGQTWLQSNSISTDPNTAMVAMWLLAIAGQKPKLSDLREFSVAKNKDTTKDFKVLAEVISQFFRAPKLCTEVSSFSGENSDYKSLGQAVRLLDSLTMISIVAICNDNQQLFDSALSQLTTVVDDEMLEIISSLNLEDAYGVQIPAVCSLTRGLLKASDSVQKNPLFSFCIARFTEYLSRFASMDIDDAYRQQSEIAMGDVVEGDLLRKLMAVNTLTLMESSYPMGGFDVVSGGLFGGIGEANILLRSTVDEKSADEKQIRWQQEHSQLIEKVRQLDEQLKDRDIQEKERMKELAAEVHTRVIIGVFLSWFVVCILGTGCVALGTNAVLALIKGSDYLAPLGALLAAIPILGVLYVSMSKASLLKFSFGEKTIQKQS